MSLLPDVHKKVFIMRGDSSYISMYESRNWQVVSSLAQASLIQFTGGEDVSPDLYGEYRHTRTFNNPERDKREMLVFKQAIANNIPMAGICRGGQFLNVMCGGRMWQHINNHTGPHFAEDTMTKERFKVSSTHHQMMRPSKEGIILLVANEANRKERVLSPGKINIDVSNGHNDDVEAVYYAEQNCLCFQPHPEHNGYWDLADKYFEYIEAFLFQGRFTSKNKLH